MPSLPDETADSSGDSSDGPPDPPDGSGEAAGIEPALSSASHPSGPLPSTSVAGVAGLTYRSWLTALMLMWMGVLAFLLWTGRHGPASWRSHAERAAIYASLLRCAGGGGLALWLTFAVPVSLVDDSSHHERSWWKAWLWPMALVGMLAADAVATTLAVLPVIKALAHE